MKLRGLIGPLVILAIWYLSCRLNIVEKLFLPSPIEVIFAWKKLIISKTIFWDLNATLMRTFMGFVFGTLTGIPIGLILGISIKIGESFEGVIDFFRSIPVLCLFPLFLVIFGLGDSAKISTAAWAISFIVIINTMYGIRNSKKTRIMVAKTKRANWWQIFYKVMFPESLPGIVVGLRIGLSYSLVVVIVTEMFTGTKSGLGMRIYNASLVYNVPEMFATIITAGLLGYFLNKGFTSIEARIVHWAGK